MSFIVPVIQHVRQGLCCLNSREWLQTTYTYGTLVFHLVVLQRTEKKCTNIQNARAGPLFCSLNFLFGDVLVAVVVVVCLGLVHTLTEA